VDDPRYHTARWQKLRAQIIRRDGQRCSAASCTKQMQSNGMTHVDHIVEVQDGGAFWEPANLRVLCWYHHTAKTLSVAASRDIRSPNA